MSKKISNKKSKASAKKRDKPSYNKVTKKTTKNEGISLYKGMIIFVCVFIVSLSLTLLFYNKWVVKDTYEIPVNVEVGEGIGVNTTSQNFEFGMLAPGQNGIKRYKVTNNLDIPLKVVLKAKGDVSEWLRAKPAVFWLEPKEVKVSELKMEIPEDAETGRYTSKILVEFKRI